MPIRKQTIGIKESFNIVGKSSNPMAPLSEAVMNSLDSIEKRKTEGDSFNPEIGISLFFQVSKDLLGNTSISIASCEVEDNGKGFTTENYERFLRLGDRLEKRPDIFLFPEEGKCILIEFKAPGVDVSLHLDQLPKYAKLIANYSKKKITQFYGYLIGENINRLDIPDRYNRAVYSGYWFNPSEIIKDLNTDFPIADLYQEIIPFSTIASRAEMRNRSFAEKLGIEEKSCWHSKNYTI